MRLMRAHMRAYVEFQKLNLYAIIHRKYRLDTCTVSISVRDIELEEAVMHLHASNYHKSCFAKLVNYMQTIMRLLWILDPRQTRTNSWQLNYQSYSLNLLSCKFILN